MLCGACNLSLHARIENFRLVLASFEDFSGEPNTFYYRFAFISLIKRYYHRLIFGLDKSSEFW